jgi:uncharacterized protein (TIGR03084 family)
MALARLAFGGELRRDCGPMDELCDDLTAEHDDLDDLVADVDDWDIATPAAGWSVRDAISHLWFFDQRALLALTDADAFSADAAALSARGVEASVEPGRSISRDELLAAWRRDRAALVEHARTVDPSARVPWYGPPMAARSFITARLMETWAHGQDVADALGRQRRPTPRLRHVAHIGVRARPYSYLVNDRPLPDVEVYVGLVAPGGERWEWGSADLADRVTGDALDFCLVVTQRRHVDDTGLVIVGPAATEWMSFAQAFAGPPGEGREPMSR